MKKVLPSIILCVALIFVVAVLFAINPKNKNNLPFLNYENLASIAAQSDTLPAIKSSEEEKSYTINGLQLAQFLNTANWTAQNGFIRNVQRNTEQNSKSSIQIEIDGTYLIIFDTDTANVYDTNTGKERYYRMSDGDYEMILDMVTPS